MWIVTTLCNIILAATIGFAAYKGFDEQAPFYSFFGVSVYLICCGFSPSQGSPKEMADNRLFFYIYASILTLLWVMYGKIFY